MSTLWVREFTGGLDVRKVTELAPGGSLIVGNNGHIDRGGAFEQRAIFKKVHTAPANHLIGLASFQGFIVGLGQGADKTTPTQNYEILNVRDEADRVPDYIFAQTLFEGRPHFTAVFSDGTRKQFDKDFNVVTLGSNAARPGALLTYGTRMYVGDDQYLRLSVLENASDYRIEGIDGTGVSPGGGFFDMSTEEEGSEEVTSLARYNNLVAVFAPTSIQTWFFDANPSLAKSNQVLNNTGTIATRSVTSFGDNDVFYLDSYGVRSLRARDSSNSAATTDIGSAIDALITTRMQELGEGVTRRAIGLIEPRDGRFWLILGDTIFVFSYFTGSQVSAWTTYSPGFVIDDAIIHKRRVYVRSGDDIYVYGAEPDEPYQYSKDVVAEAWLPYLDMDMPARTKTLQGMDASVRGEWAVSIGLDPNNEEAEDRIATISRTTFNGETIPIEKECNHVSLRFRSKKPVSITKPAKLASAAVHYDAPSQED